MGPGALSTILAKLRLRSHPALLVGLDISDDAAVYQLDERTALVQTVDFFPPIVDDPYTYGAIAAANALSDVYAMGGRPILALAIAGFPETLEPEILSAILQGGADKVAEAGAVVAGGHTVVDQEPKYGLCVTGLIEPARVTTKGGARPGDVLLLTKPIGTGLVTTALKRRGVDPAHVEAAVASMLRLNRQAAELAALVEIHAATDITGFGLLGHAAEMARQSNVGLRIAANQVPLLPGARAYAEARVAPGGLVRNMEFVAQNGYTCYRAEVAEADKLLLNDPQTSGGLLFALPPNAAAILLEHCAAADQGCWQIGEVVEGEGITVY